MSMRGKEDHSDRLSRRSLGGSLLLHLLILFGVLLIPWKPLEEIPVTSVTLVLEQFGSAGASGGTGRDAGGGAAAGDDVTKGRAAAESTNIASAASEEKPTEAAQPPTAEPPTEAAAETPPTAPPLTPSGVLPSRPKVPRPQVKPRPPPPRPVQRLVAARPVDRPPPSSTPAAEEVQRPASTETRDAAPKGTSPQPAAAAADAGSPKGVAGAGPGGAVGPGQGTAGSGLGTHGPGGDGTGDDYLERVRSWILKYRPRPPDQLKQDKATILLVALARDGAIVDVQIVESSGVPLLDQMALDWVRRASPVPPAPASIPGEPLKFRLPVDFRAAFLDKLF
jgi:periplasmic protein TonB